MSYNNNYQQGGQQNSNNNTSGPQSHVEIEILAYLAEDPTTNQVGTELVGKSKIIVNHRNGDTDSWFLDVWTNNNTQSRGTYDFLMNYCPKGKKVFIKGTPMLQNKKQQDGTWKSFPTIRVSKLVAADTNASNGGGQQQQQQGGYTPQQGGYQAPQQQQGGYPQQQGGYQPPAQNAPAPQQGSYQPPAQGGYQPPAQGGMPQQPPAQYPPAPPAGGYQPPAPGAAAPSPQYGAPAGGPYQPPQQ